MLKPRQLKQVKAAIRDALANDFRPYREGLFDFYMGEPWKHIEGRSNYQSTDVADIVEAYYAEGIEVLASDDNLVEFIPVGQEDEEAARQETQIIHQVFRETHNSFVTLSTWYKSGLIEQVGYVQAGWIEKERVKIEEYEQISPEQLAVVFSEIGDGDYDIEKLEGAEINENNEIIPILDPETGEPAPIDVRIRCVKTEKQYEIEAFPQDEFIISEGWRSPTLTGCPTCGRVWAKTKAELLAMGFSVESVDALQQSQESSGENNREATQNNDDDSIDTEKAYGVIEAYVLTDYEGDEPSKEGYERLLKIWTDATGLQVLKWKDGGDAIEEVEGLPFASFTPIPVPHRHSGKSVAELGKPMQELNTVLWRQSLDALYAGGAYARPHVAEDDSTDETIPDLENMSPGSPIRMKRQGAVAYPNANAQGVLSSTLPMMDKVNQHLETHAGASRYAAGLDPSSLAKTQIGSEGANRMMDSEQRRKQVILRTFAETGLRELFLIMHRDMRRGPWREKSIKLNGQWVQFNPTDWRERNDMTVRIGTGRADKTQRIAGLTWMLEQQMMLINQGSPYVTPQNIYETYKRLARAMGLGAIEPYIIDPQTIEPPQPQQPDQGQNEAMMMAAQAEQMKAQADLIVAQAKQMQVQLDYENQATKQQLERDIAVAKAQESQANLAIKQAELQIKQYEAELKGAKIADDITGNAVDRETQMLTGMGL